MGKQLCSPGDYAMGNQLCCRGSWSCPSTFQKKKKKGSQARRTLKKQQQQLQQNCTKDHEIRGHMYEQVLQQPKSQKRNQDLKLEESNLHYADIQVNSLTQTRSASEVKHWYLENATEYATLCFPQATPRYDSKNGTLV
uniref:Chromosome 11 open reading frame 52 n=1 Tax=Spermophilus dauricus TaxID=99837 RepID=A0A8C9NUX1_SPEDA